MRSSSAIRKIRSLSVRQGRQQDAPTSSASRDTVARARSVAATPSRYRARISSEGGRLPPASSNIAAAWRRRIRATSSQRLSPPCRSDCALCGVEVERPARIGRPRSMAARPPRCGGGRAGAPASRARCSHRRRSRVHACRSISSWRSPFEDLNRRLGQVDGAAHRNAAQRFGGGSSDRAACRSGGGSRIGAAVRARDLRYGFWWIGFRRERPRRGPGVNPLGRARHSQEPPKKGNQDHLGSLTPKPRLRFDDVADVRKKSPSRGSRSSMQSRAWFAPRAAKSRSPAPSSSGRWCGIACGGPQFRTRAPPQYRRIVVRFRSAMSQRQRHRPFGHPSCGSRGTRNSWPIREIT